MPAFLALIICYRANGGKPVVIKALKLADALELFSALGDLKTVINLAQNDTPAFNRLLLAKLPVILRFCVPDRQIPPGDITLTEFADLITAVWCVNDLGVFWQILHGQYRKN